MFELCTAPARFAVVKLELLVCSSVRCVVFLGFGVGCYTKQRRFQLRRWRYRAELWQRQLAALLYAAAVWTGADEESFKWLFFVGRAERCTYSWVCCFVCACVKANCICVCMLLHP